MPTQPIAQDHYRILGLDPRATLRDIRAAYRRKAKEFHPDVSKDKDATAKMVLVNKAYAVLGDPLSKQRYDEQRGQTWAASPARKPAPAPKPPPREPKADVAASARARAAEKFQREAEQRAKARFMQARAAEKKAEELPNADKAERDAEQRAKTADFMRSEAAAKAAKSYSLGEAQKMARYLVDLDQYFKGNPASLFRILRANNDGAIIKGWLTQRSGTRDSKQLVAARNAIEKGDLLGAAAALNALGKQEERPPQRPSTPARSAR